MNEITKEEVIQRLKDIKYSVTIAKRAVEAVETFEMMANDIESDEEAINIAIEALENQKIGHWIKYATPRCGEQHYQCTSCGYYINFGQWGELYTKEFKYCPNCCAKMKGELKNEIDN